MSLLTLCKTALLFPLSFSINFLVRNLFRLYYRILFLKNKNMFSMGSFNWKTLNELLEEKPFLINYLALTAPRWNPHALIASVGPLFVRECLEIEERFFEEGEGFWYLVIYSAPGGKTIDCLPSGKGKSHSGKIQLKPGNYTITLRIYEGDRHHLPGIEVDGGERVIEGREVEVKNQVPMESIVFNRNSFFFRFVHGYMYTMLKFDCLFSDSLVRRECLPVGNPETYFVYGVFSAGQSLRLSMNKCLFDSALIFITCYNKSSFPVYCENIVSDSDFETHHFAEDGFYVCRVVGRVPHYADNYAVSISVA